MRDFLKSGLKMANERTHCVKCKQPLNFKDSLIICDKCYFKLAERENGKR